MTAINTNSINLLKGASENLHSRGQLFERYRNYLRLLASAEIGRKLQGKADPSDVVQDTFMDAHDGFGKFRGNSERDLGRWLRTILAHRMNKLVRHYYGTRRRDIRLERQLHELSDESSQALEQALESPQTSPSQVVMGQEMAVQLADALAQLPAHYRDVVVLRHVQGLSFEEIATQLNRTPDSVRHVWWRALGQLRQQM